MDKFKLDFSEGHRNQTLHYILNTVVRGEMAWPNVIALAYYLGEA